MSLWCMLAPLSIPVLSCLLPAAAIRWSLPLHTDQMARRVPDRNPAQRTTHPSSGTAAAHHQAATIFPGSKYHRSRRLRATQPPDGFLRRRQLPGSFLQRRKVALCGEGQLRRRTARRARPPCPPRGQRRH